MKEQLNLVEILKDCPKGMELDCTMYDNVTLKSVSLDINVDYPIYIETKCGFDTKLTKYGQNICIDDAKCVIFPKGKTSWEGFQRPFVDGDIVFYNDIIAIFKEWGDETLFRTYVAKGLNCEDLIGINTPLFGKSVRNEIRFATEEEKQILFKALEENGYKWNSKTKSLEKLVVPKFKVGDKIRHKTANIDYVLEISRVYDDSYGIVGCGWMVSMEYQNEYELIPNKFNPKTLKPFDKVLVKQFDDIPWCTDFYSHFNEVNGYHTCVGGSWDYCIPYNEDTKHLVGKSEDAPMYYRY